MNMSKQSPSEKTVAQLIEKFEVRDYIFGKINPSCNNQANLNSLKKILKLKHIVISSSPWLLYAIAGGILIALSSRYSHINGIILFLQLAFMLLVYIFSQGPVDIPKTRGMIMKKMEELKKKKKI